MRRPCASGGSGFRAPRRFKGVGVGDLEKRLGGRFRDPALLKLALTHRSAVNEMGSGGTQEAGPGDNERLEFLGDAILGAVVAEELYRLFPTASEGALTVMRAELVQRTGLARWAREIDLGGSLVVGRGETRGGRPGGDALLAAGFEALVGALYLDRGYPAVRKLVGPLLDEALPGLAPSPRSRDAKSELQRRVQGGAQGALPMYRVVETEGPEHRPVFTVEVQAGPDVVARGRGPSKQAAEQEAAREALQAMHNEE